MKSYENLCEDTLMSDLSIDAREAMLRFDAMPGPTHFENCIDLDSAVKLLETGNFEGFLLTCICGDPKCAGFYEKQTAVIQINKILLHFEKTDIHYTTTFDIRTFEDCLIRALAWRLSDPWVIHDHYFDMNDTIEDIYALAKRLVNAHPHLQQILDLYVATAKSAIPHIPSNLIVYLPSRNEIPPCEISLFSDIEYTIQFPTNGKYSGREITDYSPNELESCIRNYLNENLYEFTAINDIEPLTNPTYGIDIFRILTETFAVKPFRIFWEGSYENGNLIYKSDTFTATICASNYDISCIEWNPPICPL